MPLVHDSTTETGTRLLLYAADAHAEAEFLKSLSPALQKQYQGVNLEKRKWEWLSLQWLKQHAGIESDIEYAGNGKPYIPGGPHLSISHGDGLAGLLLAPQPCGIDVQLPKGKLNLIKTKFCSAEELLMAEENEQPLEYLTLVWTAKEAVFKVFGESVNFSRDIVLEALPLREGYLDARCHRAEGIRHLKLHTFETHGHRVTHTV